MDDPRRSSAYRKNPCHCCCARSSSQPIHHLRTSGCAISKAKTLSTSLSADPLGALPSPLLADDERKLLQGGGRQVHVEVDDHVRELREVELDAVEHPTLVRVLPRRV